VNDVLAGTDDLRCWVQIDTAALRFNIRQMRSLTSRGCILAPTVKANAYGHGLLVAARAFLDAGADWLCVDSAEEVASLRLAGIEAPLHVLGHVPPLRVAEVMAAGARMVVYDTATLEAVAAEHARSGLHARLHVKIETGNQRQGLDPADAVALANRIAGTPGAILEGACTHFANVEDTTDHAFARQQMRVFTDTVEAMRSRGLPIPMRHVSNSAALILWPEAHMEMARLGIAAYGMWPSTETRIAATLVGRADIKLRPALTWKARIAQVRQVEAGTCVGYGLTYRTTHPIRLAVVPVGYYDGYDRGMGNTAHVLVGGMRAPVRGRVCMNMIMADVTDSPDAAARDEVVLLGRQGEEEITSEMMASWIGTINYEVTTRIRESLPRMETDGPIMPANADPG
jgi:alanine racemase